VTVPSGVGVAAVVATGLVVVWLVRSRQWLSRELARERKWADEVGELYDMRGIEVSVLNVEVDRLRGEVVHLQGMSEQSMKQAERAVNWAVRLEGENAALQERITGLEGAP
jgi:ABC-type phosphate transport system auxiliary subunit